jgi:hypothetical protein
MAMQDSAPPYRSEPAGSFYLPFNFSTSKIERLCLVEWHNGQKYKGLEVQYIDNPENGRGVLVILASLDDRVNVYFEPTLNMDPQGYAIGGGLRDFSQTPFERAHSEIGPYGLDLDVAFHDVDGEAVTIYIKEGGPKPPSAFSLLAPVGDSIQKPEWMPLFLLSDFSFVRRRNTGVDVRFGQEQVDVTRFPFPIGGSRVYIARYCADPFIIFWNKQFDGPIAPLHPPGPGLFVHAGVEYELVERVGHFEIAAAVVRSPRHAARLTFTPPFPAVAHLAAGAEVTGSFTITGDPLHGQVGGVYSAARQGNNVHLRLHPSRGWTPADQGWMLRLIFNLGKPFRNWPKTYEWNAVLTFNDDVHNQSGWRRIE